MYSSNADGTNAVLDAETKPTAGLDSDHYPLILKLRLKVARDLKKREPKPSLEHDADRTEYEHVLHGWAATAQTQGHRPDWQEMAEQIHTARTNCFRPIAETPKKDYISPDTWTLIKQRRSLLQKLAATPHR